MSACNGRPTRTDAGSARDRCRLVLVLNGFEYAVRPLRLTPGRAYRLTKYDGTWHDVEESPSGDHRCDCGDFTWRRQGRTATGCKHVRSLIALGLLSGPPSAPN